MYGPTNQRDYRECVIEPPAKVLDRDETYVELDVTTNFSFLRGASYPDEYVCQAAVLGYHRVGITDINSLAGIVRAWEKAREIEGFKLVVGTRLVFTDGTPDLLVYPTDKQAYGRLCQLLTLGRRRAPKGECHITMEDFLEQAEGQHVVISFASDLTGSPSVPYDLMAVVPRSRISVAMTRTYCESEAHSRAVVELSRRHRIPLVAMNHVHYHEPGRRMLQDVVTCTRHGCTIHNAGYRLFPNAERYLKSPGSMEELFADLPRALARSVEIAKECTFSLKDLQYEYPVEATPLDTSPSQYLRMLTYEGAFTRYPKGIPWKVVKQIKKELKFICGSKYESYFLTVYDLVREARFRGILCQGRGSAANSAVCFCLGVTAVNPEEHELVFERFASDARNEPPDIDIDFEHERREEIIQYAYDKYGRDHAAMTSTVITYRSRSAIRDVGKALGLSGDLLDQLSSKLDWWHEGKLTPEQLAAAGIHSPDATIQLLRKLVYQLRGFPRHLSQHVGGIVISRSPLCHLVPIENASMEGRTVIEWDKDDLGIVGLFKVDILALGMLTAISKAFAMINGSGGVSPPSKAPCAQNRDLTREREGQAPSLTENVSRLELYNLPSEDTATYDMICTADTIGVFQIESRAQMSMLPRLRPRKFYDLVIEVAIVRPGPIQGKMVHPYLKNREAQREDPQYKVSYPKQELEEVLKNTLGIPLFQEQAMRMAMVAAKFTGTEADQLRKAMAAWKRHGGVGKFRDKFINGMINNGYEPKYAENCFQQISGFGEYGFPESHAASFAHLVCASAWIKRHHPAVFAAALLNSQPMGFYAPAQLIRDAREHGVLVRPPDVNHSDWDCTLEENPLAAHPKEKTSANLQATGVPNRPDLLAELKRSYGREGPALRLGLRLVRGMKEADAICISEARTVHGPFHSVEHLQQLARLDSAVIKRLAQADALASLNLTRRQAFWNALAHHDASTPLLEEVAVSATPPPPPSQLPVLPLFSEVHSDYSTIGLSLKRHPVAFARAGLARLGVVPAALLRDEARFPHGKSVSVAGLVLVRQRPGTASGIVFVTLEDETGIANLILQSFIYDHYRQAARHASLLHVDGIIQRQGQGSHAIIHIFAKRLYDRTPLLSHIPQKSRDFH